VAGGYIQVHEDKVIVLADHAVVASQIDVDRAKAALEHLKERMGELPAEQETERGACEAELKWCEMQLEVARRHG
jgi:F-type H+-transporting ATPase subunit epsilon